MACMAPAVNARGPLYVHPKGIVKRTTFHVLAMYANELQNCVGACEIESDALVHDGRTIPVVDAIATANETRTAWSIAVINRHPSKTAACTLALPQVALDGSYDAVVLAGDSPDAYNDRERPDRVAPQRMRLACKKGVVSLAPHSLTIVKVPAK